MCLADVQTGVGPFLAIYLTATRHWDPARVGIVVSIQTLATIVAQPVAGAWVDVSHHKRWLIVGASVVVALGSLATVAATTVPFEIAAQVPIGMASALFPPTVAAISLGIVGHRGLTARIGRNEAFNHGGNVVFAALAGVLGTLWSPAWIFRAVSLLAFGSVLAALAIRPGDVDDDLARGGIRTDEVPRPTTWRDVASDRRVLVFGASVLLFHFANAAMLPLVGERLSESSTHGASLYMSACILVAQAVMVPVAVVTARFADRWGRKPVFQVGFAVLMLRGLLYTLSNRPGYLIAVQGLDGVGASVFGVLWVVVLSDLARGTGRFNLLQGTIQACLGAGAFLSTFVTGFIVKQSGFTSGFLLLSGIAGVGLTFFSLLMPETGAIADRSTA